MYTFHAIDTYTGTLSNMAHLNKDEIDQHMLEVESKFWACQVVCDLTGKKVVWAIGENGQWEVHHKEGGF